MRGCRHDPRPDGVRHSRGRCGRGRSCVHLAVLALGILTLARLQNGRGEDEVGWLGDFDVLTGKVYISGPAEYNDNSASWISVDEAIESMDIVMLLRVQFERHSEAMSMSKEEYHLNYGLTYERMKKMQDHAIIMHPAPINRGVEIADEVAECEKSRIYKQMTNGVYVRMAVVSMSLDGKL